MTTGQKVGLAIGAAIAGAAIYCGVTKCLKSKIGAGLPAKGAEVNDPGQAATESAPTQNNADGERVSPRRGAGAEFTGSTARRKWYTTKGVVGKNVNNPAYGYWK